jgi:hypothetical protein
MPIVMNMRWEGVSIEQYDAVRGIVGWETNRPPGAIYHVAAHDGTAMVVTDVWDTAQDFDTFVASRLMPGVAQVGVTSQPEVSILPAHAIFAPGYQVTLPQQKAAANS